MSSIAPVVVTEPGNFHMVEARSRASAANVNIVPSVPSGAIDPITKAQGYRFCVVAGATMLATTDAEFEPLTDGKVVLLNKAIMDVRMALNATVRELGTLGPPALGMAKSAALTRYEDFFGTFSSTNRDYAVANYKKIQAVLDGTRPQVTAPTSLADKRKAFEAFQKPTTGPSYASLGRASTLSTPPTTTPAASQPAPGLWVQDSRNDSRPFWRGVFAFTNRNAAHNNAVVFYVARGFFNGQSNISITKTDGLHDGRTQLTTAAEVRGDATVVTFVHELAHACFWASDVPTVTAMTSGLVLNSSGMPPDNDHAIVTIPDCKDLALAYPGLALINAESYGQYAFAVWRHDAKSKLTK